MSILYPIKGEIELTDSYSRYSNQGIAEEYKSYWILSSHHLEQLECQKIMINRALGVSDIQVPNEVREKRMEGEYDNCSIESFVSALIELQNTLF